MQTYDTLPKPLRSWLCQASLPWSPASARKIWNRGQSRGLSTDETLALLVHVEHATLAKDQKRITPAAGLPAP